jgi:RNA polymerase sigma factor (sigma-70 family)
MANIGIKDGVLIKRYLEGNTAAFEILVNRHKDRIYGSVFNIVLDTYLAEDIFQETFIKVIHNIKAGKYNHEDKFLPWALRIARNMAIDSLRKRKRMPMVVTSDGSDLFETLYIADKSAEDIRVQNEEHSELYRWIHQLPEEQKEVLVLRSYAQLSFKEIAAVTGTNINTCIGRMHYALSNLRRMSEKNPVKIK